MEKQGYKDNALETVKSLVQMRGFTGIKMAKLVQN